MHYMRMFREQKTSESEQLDPGVRSSTVRNLKCTHKQARPEAARLPCFTRKAACLISVTSGPPVPLRYGSPAWARGRMGNWQLYGFATHTTLGPCCIWLFLNIRNHSRVLNASCRESTKRVFSRGVTEGENWKGENWGGGSDCIIFRGVDAGLATRNRLRGRELHLALFSNFRYRASILFFFSLES